MKTEQFCVILCHPDESRNIGSVCRAMANNDILDLRIVGKKSEFCLFTLFQFGKMQNSLTL